MPTTFADQITDRLRWLACQARRAHQQEDDPCCQRCGLPASRVFDGWWACCSCVDYFVALASEGGGAFFRRPAA